MERAIPAAEIIAGIRCELQTPKSGPSLSHQAANGFFLTRDELTASYAIIRHNVRTYRSAGVVAVIRGKQNAESELKSFQDSQGSADRHEGWRYFIEKTDQKAGTDPTEATHRRQEELEARESKAIRDEKTSVDASPDDQP
jgi:hypothetical protein